MSVNERYDRRRTSGQFSTFTVVFVDFIIFNTAYFASNFFKRGTVNLTDSYINLLILFYICWLVSSFTAKKFDYESYESLKAGVYCFVRSFFYMIYCITFAIVFVGISGISRIQVFSTCLIVLVLECVAWLICYKLFFITKSTPKNKRAISSLSQSTSPFLLVLVSVDLLLLVSSFFCVNYFKRGNFVLLPDYEVLFLVILGVWFSVSIATEKFRSHLNKHFTLTLAQWWKAGLVSLALLAVVVFGFGLFHFSRFQVFGSIVVLMVLETVFLKIYFLWRKGEVERDDIDSVESVKKILNQKPLACDVDLEDLRKKMLEPVKEQLFEKLRHQEYKFFKFVSEHVDLESILCMETAIDHNYKINSFIISQTPVRLMLHMNKMNDIRRINEFLLDIHQLLLPGGFFICRAHTLLTHKEWVFSKYPRYIARNVYLIDFLINRVLPKLPFFDKIYFALTSGKNRLISRAELLGRLNFCGFEIIAEKVIEKRLCVIVRKAKTPSIDVNPTYGPLVELKRVGYGNNIIKTYKVRTMHPYSEYLQKYVNDNFGGTIDGDGFQNDFRITGWGKLFRKFWIDELPMLLNWLKGDLKIVGVRPISEHKFSMYSKENQALRSTVKPGLVPPFYADLPSDFEGLQISEAKYIKLYHENPIKTDIQYFFKVMWNIFVKKARSK